MKKIPFPRFTFIYFWLCVITIAAGYLHLQWTFYLSKPLVMLSIFFFFRMEFPEYGNKRFKNLMLFGFLFCLIGDALLMFEGNEFFIGGLIMFLLAHINYALAFLVDMIYKPQSRRHWGQLAFATLLVVFSAEFFIINRTSFGDLKWAVLAYAIAITIMGVVAVMRNKNSFSKSYFTVVTGALFFIISDAILATDKFVSHLHYAEILIKGFYFTAQYLIAVGCIAAAENTSSRINPKNTV